MKPSKKSNLAYILIPFLIPITLLIQSYFSYVKNPIQCIYDKSPGKKLLETCLSYSDFLTQNYFLIAMSLFLGVYISFSLYLFLHNKKKIGLFVLLPGILICILIIILLIWELVR